LVEFTGERVVPGQVAPDLWNEHFARYAFAARLARHRRVLDIGCGAGYGSAELARVALNVIGLDPSEEALAAAREKYALPNLAFHAGSGDHVPFPDAGFDLITAFEVIEHIENWPALLAEARRLLAPGGQFVISTPNKLYYAESRKLSGPNPFHVHEFEFAEFKAELERIFPSVAIFLQNHVQGIAFQPAASLGTSTELSVEQTGLKPEDSHFFLAVCALAQQTGAPTYVYLPSTTNLLRERERHIELLESELKQKNEWLEAAKSEHAKMVELFRQQLAEMESRTKWIEKLEQELKEAHRRHIKLRDEMEQERQKAMAIIGRYDEKIAELERDLAARHEAAMRIDAELKAKCEELAHCVDLLTEAEKTVVERTQWAQDLDAHLTELRATLATAQASRWVRLGRKIGVGPDLAES
jgi:SAM-dependent methyltransferase